MSADYPSKFLLRVLLTLARDDPEGYNRAIETGNLKGYLASYIWLGLIDESLVDQYLKFPSLFYAKYILDSAVDEGALKLDKFLFAPCHETVPADDWGVNNSLQSFQSVAKVQHPLKKLKVGCFMGSFICAGLSLTALSRGKIPSTTAWAVASADLIQISYNCYDKRYNELYLDKLGGNLNNICDTVFSCAKSLLQIDRNPIWRMCTEIDHTLLVKDTRALKLLHIVSFLRIFISYVFCCSRVRYVLICLRFVMS